MKKRYLTKSRYKLATECPTKLFYTGKPEYANQNNEDSFLEALAEGGFQVGELAKLYFPGGQDITAKDYETSVQETNKLLQQEQAIIYEAAIQVDNFFIRADILCKNGDDVELIEVKAKSIDMSGEDDPFLTKKEGINAGWKPYIYDIAFQKQVLTKAFPKLKVTAFLMLADKTAHCPTDGLNQKFRIITNAKGRKEVVCSKNITQADLNPKILRKINVDAYCNIIYNEKTETGVSYTKHVQYLADCYAKDEKIISFPTSACKKCEFYTNPEEDKKDLKSGYKECWKHAFHWKDEDFEVPTVLDVWDFRKAKKLLENGTIKMTDITEEDISPKPDEEPGISHSERQWLQIQKVQEKDTSIWIDKENLQREIRSWVYPLHFIDFETTMVAIPFNKGRRPYEGIAFQFSHHVVHKNGKIEHKDEFLNVAPGVFPNYEFLRALKRALETDKGTIFRYSNHENTFLNHIAKQLQEDETAIPDKEVLLEFIKTITKSTGSSVEQWEGSRNMIDLWKLVKRYYYDPLTQGSNSIKQVLPAILNSSTFLREKYSKPIYGAKAGISSHNFKDWQWLKLENGKVIDPYKQLPLLFQDADKINEVLFSNDDSLCDGGGALTAYAKLQFEEMSTYEREEIHAALLKYCELDTLAMVMIYEGWQDLLKV